MLNRKSFIILVCALSLGCGAASKSDKEEAAPNAGLPSGQQVDVNASKNSAVIKDSTPRHELVFNTIKDTLTIKVIDGKNRFGLKKSVVKVDLTEDSIYAGVIEFPKTGVPGFVVSKYDAWTKQYNLSRVKTKHKGTITAYQSDDHADAKIQTYGAGKKPLYTHIVASRPKFEVELHNDKWQASYQYDQTLGLIPGRDQLETKQDELSEKELIERDREIDFSEMANAMFASTLLLEQVQQAISDQIKKGDVSEITPQDIEYIRTYISISTKE